MKGNKGIFIVRESYVYGGMFMYGCVCVFVSLGDGGSVGSQGKRAAAMACGRPRWSSAVVPIGDGMVKLKK